jgi:dihydrofolate synthase/folylpolyglutamate synthase
MPKVNSAGAARAATAKPSRTSSSTSARPKATAKPATSRTPQGKSAAKGVKSVSKTAKPASKPVSKPSAKSSAGASRPAQRTIVETKPSAGPAECPKAADITTMNAAMRFLMARPDFERQRSVRYGEHTFKLERMQRLVELLGSPHQQIKTVHVAGTNGKGSTVAMIASMLRSAGYAVGTYTSPHLVDIRERIQIDGQQISKTDFVERIREVAKAAEKLGEQPTFFEIVTAAAFLHFAQQAVDIAVVEVGLGGRLDSTNVITPLVSVVTGIDLDHTKLLGATKAQIAREKAGIFKQGVPALFFEQEAEVDQVMRDCAQAAGAELRIVNKDIEFSSRFCVAPDIGPHTRVCMYTRTTRLEHVPVPLPGEHQAMNCGLALAAIDILKGFGFDVPDDRLTAGLAATRVPGRMELVSQRPRILCDGAHNPAAMGALMRCVGAHVPYDSMVCVFGCCSDKDVAEMIDKVNLGADKVIFTRAAATPRAADPEDLQKLFQERSGKMSQIARSVPEAIEMAVRGVSREDLVCVTGSFYVVGEALKYLSERK